MKITKNNEKWPYIPDHPIENFADIDYQDFIKIHRECTQQPYNFLTIDTTLPASDPLGFRKNLFDPL